MCVSGTLRFFFFSSDAEVQLSKRMDLLSLESGNVSLVLQNFVKRKQGPQLQVVVSKSGAVEELRQIVSKQEQCKPADVRFYLYVFGGGHRIGVGVDAVLLANWPYRISPLFYSVVKEGQVDPPSPEEQLREFKEEIEQKLQERDRRMEEQDRRMEEQDRTIGRLEFNSATAGVREKVFKECVEVSFESWKSLVGIGDDDGDGHKDAQVYPNS